MMGNHNDRGVIPRLSEAMFDRIGQENNRERNVVLPIDSTENESVQKILAMKFSSSFRVEVSYFEIYNEKVRDLLNPKK